MTRLILYTLFLFASGTVFAQSVETQYTNGTTTAHYSVSTVFAQGGDPYSVIVCVTTSDSSADAFRIQYSATLADGSTLQYDGFLTRRERSSCRMVASVAFWPSITGLIVTPHHADAPLVAVPLPCDITKHC